MMWVLRDVQRCPRILSTVLRINESWGQPKLVLLIQYFERPHVLAILVLVLRICLACLNRHALCMHDQRGCTSLLPARSQSRAAKAHLTC